MKKVLKRVDYINLINDIIDTPSNALDEQLQSIEDEYFINNQHLYDNLYKDISYILERYDLKGDGDLVIENGDLVIERGDIKLTGKQTNLHGASRWCWMKIISKKTESVSFNPNDFIRSMEKFDNDFLKYDEYSPDYKGELNKIAENLRRHRIGKKNKKEIKDIPLWLKITGAFIGVVSTVLTIFFKPEVMKFIRNTF